MSSPESSTSLRSKVLRGSTWTTLGYFVSRVLRLGSNLLLAYLLFPEAFGLMALVNVVLMGITMLSDVGLVPSIVQSPRGEDARFVGTAWTIQIARGFVLWALACGVSPLLAGFYEQPELALLLPVASFSMVITGFESMSVARFRRRLQLERIVLLELGAQVIGTLAMLVWAWFDRSVWALVGGGLAGAAARVGISHAISIVRDRPRWDPDSARELVGFGKWIFASTLAAFLSSQLDRLIFGKTIPIALLGVYGIAAMIAMLPGEILARLGQTVMFPAFSRKHEGADLPSAYERARLPLAAVAGLTVAPLVAAGGPLIEALYDARYAEAGWIVQVLAAGAWFQALEVAPGSALLALGRPQWVAFSHAVKVVGIAIGVPAGFALAGFPGAVAGLAGSQLLLYATATFGARRFGLGRLGGDLALTALVALSAGCGLLVVEELQRAGVGPWPRLAVGGVVPVVLWAVSIQWLLWRSGLSLRTALSSRAAAG